MRTSHRREPLFSLLLPLILAPTALAYSLVDVQQISGFGSACTNAYSTPFTSCTSNDFNGDKGCSTACASSLPALLANIDEACNGHTAFPDTLIGLIFSGGAFNTLCPGSTGSAGSSGGSAGGSGGGGGGEGSNDGNGQASVHLSLATNLVASQTSTTFAPKTSTSSYGLHSYLTPVATPSTTPKSPTSSTLTPTSTPALSTNPSTTPQTSSPTSISTIPLSELTRVTTTPTATRTASITSSSSKSQQTSQGSNPQGAGGGTPFDITSDSCRNRRSSLWAVSVLPIAIFVLLWLV